MTDVFGNYVVQKLFDNGSPAQRENLASFLVGHAVQLSLQMYGCRVVQKALEYASIDTLIALVSEFGGQVRLSCMASISTPVRFHLDFPPSRRGISIQCDPIVRDPSHGTVNDHLLLRHEV